SGREDRARSPAPPHPCPPFLACPPLPRHDVRDLSFHLHRRLGTRDHGPSVTPGQPTCCTRKAQGDRRALRPPRPYQRRPSRPPPPLPPQPPRTPRPHRRPRRRTPRPRRRGLRAVLQGPAPGRP